MLAKLMATALVFASTAAHAQDRWMSIPQAPNMPESVSSGIATVNGIDMYHAIYGDSSALEKTGRTGDYSRPRR